MMMGFGPAAKSKWWCWRDNPKHTQQDKAIGCVAEFKKLLRAMIFFSNGWLLSQNHPYAHPPALPLCSSHVYYSEIKKDLGSWNK
jgi:hypothetical protein